MKGANCINLGEQLITVVKSKKVAKSQILPNHNNITKLTLNKNDLLELTKNDDVSSESSYLFGHYLYDWYDWSLDIAHKLKSDYEIITFALKEHGIEIIKGAYSKLKTKKGEIKKFHFTDGDKDLQTGYTNANGIVKQSKTTEIFPEKYMDYLWTLSDRSLLIISDYFGLLGKRKTPEKIGEEWGIKANRVKDIKNQIMWRTRDRIRDRIRDGWKPLKETKNHYTVADYICALRKLQDNEIYKYMCGRYDCTLENPIIDDKFLNEVKEIRKCQNIIKEWREASRSK